MNQSNENGRGAERWVLAVAILASSMAFIDGSALNLALPALQRDLGATGRDLLWIMNGYLLFLSALILAGGSLGDIYGRKRIFGAGIGLFAGASLLCGLAPSTEFLIGSRMLQGVGGALMVPGSLAIITASVAPQRRGESIGTWSALSTVTTLLGPLLGGYLASIGLWRAIFFINVPLGLLTLGILIIKIPETMSVDADVRLDIPGTIAVTLGLAGITYGFIEAPEVGFSVPRIFLSLGIGFAALVSFIYIENQSQHPMVPLRLFRSNTFSGANVLTLLLYAALNSMLFFLPLNLIQVQGYNERIAGLTFVPFTLIMMLLSRWAGVWCDRRGAREPLTVGPLVAAIGFVMLSLPGETAGASEFWTTFFPGLTVFSIGMSITVAPLSTAVMNSVPEQRAGTASGVNNAISRIAGVLSIAIMGSIVLLTFQSQLQSNLNVLQLQSGTEAQVMQEAENLAAAQAPQDIPSTQQAVIREAIDMAFISAFRLQSIIAAALAGAGSLLAWIILDPMEEPERADGAI